MPPMLPYQIFIYVCCYTAHRINVCNHNIAFFLIMVNGWKYKISDLSTIQHNHSIMREVRGLVYFYLAPNMTNSVCHRRITWILFCWKVEQNYCTRVMRRLTTTLLVVLQPLLIPWSLWHLFSIMLARNLLPGYRVSRASWESESYGQSNTQIILTTSLLTSCGLKLLKQSGFISSSSLFRERVSTVPVILLYEWLLKWSKRSYLHSSTNDLFILKKVNRELNLNLCLSSISHKPDDTTPPPNISNENDNNDNTNTKEGAYKNNTKNCTI